MERLNVSWCWISFLGLVSSPVLASDIEGIDLRRQDGQVRLEIKGGDLDGVKAFQKVDPPQLILQFPSGKIGPQVQSGLDYSPTGTDIDRVTTVLENGDAKIVVQFKKMPKYSVKSQSDLVFVDFEGVDESVAGQKSGEAEELLVKFQRSRESRVFSGSPITLKLKDADITDVFRMISEASGFSIAVHPNVKGPISVTLDRVPWDQALDTVLNMQGLGAERNESVLRVMTLKDMNQEREERLRYERLALATAPKITRVYPINYADLNSLTSTLRDYSKSMGVGVTDKMLESSIIADPNNRSVIVRDSAENVERLRKMIEVLDVPTPQVLIEAKVVEAGESFSKELNGASSLGGNRIGAGFNGSSPLSNLLGSADFVRTGGGSFGFSPIFSAFNGTARLNAAIRLGEQENKLKLISSPKTVVMSGKSSSVSQVTKSVVYDQTTVNNGTTVVTPMVVPAEIKLNVIPRVTNDGSIYLKLTLVRGIIDATTRLPTVNPRTIETEVLIESGQTLVVGGVISADEEASERGFPILRKIPIIGALFGSESSQQSKNELLFFITPKVMNAKKVGVGKI